MTEDTTQSTTVEQDDPPELFSDAYFSRGHWLLKIRQTLVALLGWACAILPLIMTYFILTRPSLTFFGYTISLTNGVLPSTTSPYFSCSVSQPREFSPSP